MNTGQERVTNAQMQSLQSVMQTCIKAHADTEKSKTTDKHVV